MKETKYLLFIFQEIGLQMKGFLDAWGSMDYLDVGLVLSYVFCILSV